MQPGKSKIQPVPSIDDTGVDTITEPELDSPWRARVLWLLALSAVGAVGWVAWGVNHLYSAIRQQQVEIREQLSQTNTELEQLRTDVITTTSENSIYLKVMLLRPGIDKGLARDIAHSVALRSREHHRDPDLTLAIIAVESNFNPNATSNMGALGLMQIMPPWKASFGIDRDLHDVDTSINYGLKILGSYEQMFGGIELSLTAYNRGPAAVANDMKVGRIPYNGYAENIMRTYSRIRFWTRP